MSIVPTLPTPIDYPESDGQPMADNTLQLEWILVLVGNLRGVFRDRPDVFVGGNQNWYPEEGHPEIVNAPDTYVIFDRPKGHRSSYKQWEEGDVPMTVVFEILSPSNSGNEMAKKFMFYEEHGVEEYYIYDPQRNTLEVWLRHGTVLRRHWEADDFISPLGIRFDLSGPEMVVYGPDGERFLTFEELLAILMRAKQDAEHARKRANQADQRANSAELRADQATKAATEANRLADEEKQRADDQKRRADAAEQRVARILDLSRKARRNQATPDELAELDRLDPSP